MLKKRIIPLILFRGFNTYKGKNFNNNRLVSDLVSIINIYNLREADELMLIDLDSSTKKDNINLEILNEVSYINHLPLSFGGGVSSLKDIEKILKKGADKVVVNSYNYIDLSLIKEATRVFGSQCIIGSVDYKYDTNQKKYILYKDCGKNKLSINSKDWVSRLIDSGIGELMLTSIDNDGELKGLDFKFMKYLKINENIPILISGGTKDYKDFLYAFKKHNVSAVVSSSIYIFTEHTPQTIKKKLLKDKISIRVV